MTDTGETTIRHAAKSWLETIELRDEWRGRESVWEFERERREGRGENTVGIGG